MPISVVVAVTVLAVSVAVIIAVLAAVTAGFLARREGASPAAAVSRAGMAFAATLSLLALLTTTVSDLLG
ncbi:MULTISPECIES: hypothetical protein [unclassified Streptomyces]|uniref:hypothetical protein n=1 Tax=unclassified Streptomyces TaxID=2593676 RepID=UPI0004C5D572|nr:MULTISPECIES: hypothetical protein [unclassified Streptomyces]